MTRSAAPAGTAPSRGARRVRAAATVLAALALLLGVTSCSNGPGVGTTAAAAVPASTLATQRWYVAVHPSLQALTDVLDTARHEVARHDVAALGTTCATLRHAVTRVRAHGPAPDRVVRTALARAVRLFTRAATHCLAGRYRASGRAVRRGERFAGLVARRLRTLAHAARATTSAAPVGS